MRKKIRLKHYSMKTEQRCDHVHSQILGRDRKVTLQNASKMTP